MNRSLLLVLLFLFPVWLQAQPKMVMSPGFEEPEPGTKKLLILKNGNVAYLNITPDNIETKIFDQQGKQLSMRKIPHSQWTDRKMSASTFGGLYEINNEIVLFYHQTHRGNVEVLKRIHLDAATGKFNRAKEILRLGETSAILPVAVKVDEATGHQVVFYITDTDYKSFKAQFYDDQFNPAGEATLTTQDSILDYHNLVFHNGTLYAQYSYKLRKWKEERMALMLATLKEGDNAFEIHDLKTTVPSDMNGMKMVHNPATNTCHTVLMYEERRKGGFNGRETVYSSIEQKYVNYNNFEVVEKGMGGELNSKALGMGITDGYHGVLENVFSTGKNANAVVCEELSYYYTKSATETRAGNLGIAIQDETGKVKEAYVIERMQASGRGFMRNRFEIEQYFGYYYFNAPDAGYIIFNDIPENFDKEPGKKAHYVTTISDANAILYKMVNGKVTKSYLFGAPKDKRSGNYAMPGSMAYNAKDNTLAMLMVNNDRGNKKVHLALVQL